jgi:hypothetical protein
MVPKSQRDGRLPGELKTSEEPESTFRRQTKFPGGTPLQDLTILDKSTEAETKRRHRDRLRLPVRVNQPCATPSRPPPTATAKKEQWNETPKKEDPWSTYTSLGTLERGGNVTAAYTRDIPVKMVTVKKLSSDFVKELPKCKHENLLTVIGLYQHEGEFFVITDYTVVTLQQINATRLPLHEPHVSVTCLQGSFLSGGHSSN